MLRELLGMKKELTFERVYAAPIEKVWDAWTQPDQVRQWWGTAKTVIPECEIDLTVGGTIHIVMEGGQEMGRYAGTRWPVDGTFTQIDPPHQLAYEARSWTEGDEDSYVRHLTKLELSQDGDKTVLHLTITIHETGPSVKAKFAVVGMKMGYKDQFNKLEEFLAR